MASGQEGLLFGRLALHYKLITAGQLDEVHGLHALAGGRRQLPEILVEMGYLTPRQVEQLLVVQNEYLEKRRARAATPAAPTPEDTVATPDALPRDTAGMPVAEVSAPRVGAAMGLPSGSALPPIAAFSAAGTAAVVSPGGVAGQRQLEAVLQVAVERGASDVHVHSGAPIGLRLLGRLEDLDPQPLAPAVAARMIDEVLDDSQRAALARDGQVDFAYALPGHARFRANAYRQQRGVDAVFRTIPSEPPTLQSLGLPESLARLADHHQGMVLITGPSGCGKSATMAALINILNQTRTDHIITIEDPIEYLHSSRRAIVNQRQVGPHSASFARALRAALREDPDVIAIGELRDLETTSLAIAAAETGHLVLGTLHTNGAVRTINRMLGVFPPDQQPQMRTMISESLRAVVSQRLLARADGRGRVPALEVLMVTKAAANLIRENKTYQIRSILQTGAAHGMTLLDASLAELVRKGVVSRDEALLHAEDAAKIPS
jgi:twitching motility protein PilT